MLCVTRKEDEFVSIRLEDGRQIIISVRQIRRKQVRIGIEADPSIVIWRGELEEEENDD